MVSRMSVVCMVLMYVVSGHALAKDGVIDAANGVFAQQRAQLEAALADGETYSEISPGDRATVVKELDRMEALLGSRSVPQLSEAEKVELMNSQEVVNAALTKASEDSRLVCRREPVAGSRLPRSQCLTVAERRRQRENSQDAIDQFNRGHNKGSAFAPGFNGN